MSLRWTEKSKVSKRLYRSDSADNSVDRLTENLSGEAFFFYGTSGPLLDNKSVLQYTSASPTQCIIVWGNYWAVIAMHDIHANQLFNSCGVMGNDEAK